MELDSSAQNQREAASLEFVEAALPSLDKVAMLPILQNMDPQGILDLCSSSKRFRSVCDNKELMRDVILHHYPGEDPTSDPPAKFRELAQARIHYWWFYVDRNSNRTFFVSTNPITDYKIKDYSEHKVEIRKDVRIPKGTKVFVTVDPRDGNTQAFLRMEESLDYARQFGIPTSNIYDVELVSNFRCFKSPIGNSSVQIRSVANPQRPSVPAKRIAIQYGLPAGAADTEVIDYIEQMITNGILTNVEGNCGVPRQLLTFDKVAWYNTITKRIVFKPSSFVPAEDYYKYPSGGSDKEDAEYKTLLMAYEAGEPIKKPPRRVRR